MTTRQDLLNEADDYRALADESRHAGNDDRADDQAAYAQQLQAEAAGTAPDGWDRVDAGLEYDANGPDGAEA